MSQHDMVLDNGPGLAVRTDMNAAIQALASTNSGPTEPTTPYSGQFWLDTTVAPNGTVRMRNQANSAWIRLFDVVDQGGIDKLVSVPADMSVLFRTSPNRWVINDKADGTGKDVFVVNENGGTTAQTRSRVVNGAMQISQENGSAAGTTNGYYPADQWDAYFATTGALSLSRPAAVTPAKSQYRLYLGVTTADTSLAAGEFCAYRQKLEGTRIADFGWGAAGASQVVLRFGFIGPVGTYSVALVNGANNRSYVTTFTVASAADATYTIIIPGDVTGTWPKDNTLGLQIVITFAANSALLTAPNVWTAGLFLGATGMSNGLGVTSAAAGVAFNLYDVGLYLDPQNTGAAPPWQMPDEAQELAACMRYWQVQKVRFSGNVTSTASYGASGTFTVPLRTASAALSGVSTAAISFANAVGTLTLNPFNSAQDARSATASAQGSFVTDLTANARM